VIQITKRYRTVSISPGRVLFAVAFLIPLLACAAASADSGSVLVVNPTSLTFNYQQGGAMPATQTLSASNGRSSHYSVATSGAAWLTVAPTSGYLPASIKVSVNPGSLVPGTYNASVTVSTRYHSVNVPITFTVTAPISKLSVSPTSLTFNYQQGGTTPSAQSLSVASSGTAIAYTDSSSGGLWLSVSKTNGTTPGTIAVSIVNTSSLSVGTYNGSVSISSNNGSANVPVTLNVTSSSSGGGGTTNNSYVLLGWAELGMHCMDGKDYSVASVLPPYNTVFAKLLTKGSQPVPVTSGVTITYTAMADSTASINTTSYGTSTVAQKTNFWSFVRSLFLGQPAPDVGLHNYPVQSTTPNQMTYDSTRGLWTATGVPTVPYDDAGNSKAYPMVQLVAKDSSGNVLATTTTVLAVSDEMSCKNCHGPNTNPNAMPSGGWITGYTDAQNMKLNMLKKHDDDNQSKITAAMLSELASKGYNYQASLYQTAKNFNNPILCAACHASNALNAAGMNTGITGVPALTASMHTMHATVTLPGGTTTLDNQTDTANSCYQCHPGVNTKCQRGAMTGTITSMPAPYNASVACYSCHGSLSRVGQSSRQGWLDEPNCQMCHQNGTIAASTFTSAFPYGPTATQVTSTDTTFATTPNVPSTGYSLYRFSQGHGSTECSACHGSQHAEFPTSQANDNVSSINLQGYAGRITECTVCHSTAPSTANGGPHGMHTVGQAWVGAHGDHAAGGGSTQCASCHGADFKGTALSQLLTTKTFNADDYGTKTFSAGHQISCYDCHNGPNGG
jgi:hypothetical protein